VASTDARWVDNLISRFRISGVEESGRGASRRLTLAAIREIALIRSLSNDLGIPLPNAVPIAQSLLADPELSEVPVGSWLRVAFDRNTFCAHVDSLVADGVEAITPTRRGRPPLAQRNSG
jgi:hypothetical protein